MKYEQDVRCTGELSTELRWIWWQNLHDSRGLETQLKVRQYLLFSIENPSRWMYLKVVQIGTQGSLSRCFTKDLYEEAIRRELKCMNLCGELVQEVVAKSVKTKNM